MRFKHRRISKERSRRLLLNRVPKDSICAEIGVWKGDFSAQILETAVPRELHLIDPWMFQPDFPDRMYGGAVAGDQADMERIYESVRDRFAAVNNVLIHRGTSASVLPTLADAFLDWVYIDGNHRYEYVLEDLKLAHPRVRPGGFLCGDDYDWGEDLGYPVRRAVADFADELGAGIRVKIIGSQFMIRV
jgi:hypothetical protein